MKADEQRLLLRLLSGTVPRGMTGIHPKRLAYLCGKFVERDWYAYGVTLDLGWLTPEGRDVAEQLAAVAQSTSRLPEEPA